MCKLVSCFIKASIIQEHKEEYESCFVLSVLPYYHNDDIDLGIKIMTHNLLKNSFNKGNIIQRDIDKLYDAIQIVLWQLTTTVSNGCHLIIIPIKSCVFGNFDEQNSASFTDVKNVISSFGSFYANFIENPSVLNTIEEKFFDYQFSHNNRSLLKIWKKAEVSDGS